VIGVVALLVTVLASVLAPLISPYPPNAISAPTRPAATCSAACSPVGGSRSWWDSWPPSWRW
jgi:hypothetical protein